MFSQLWLIGYFCFYKDYILCHPYLNKLIQFDYNFYDEEMVDIYVSFIKSLALCLNENSIQFFYN